jgi:hypothetical protein
MREQMIYKIILNIIMVIGLLRGVFVFDMGPSAADTNTTTSAICLLAAAIAAGALLSMDVSNRHKS